MKPKLRLAGMPLAPMHIVVPGKVIEVSFSTCDDETRRESQGAPPGDLYVVFCSASKSATMQVKEVRAVVPAKTTAAGAEEVSGEDERRNAGCPPVRASGRSIETLNSKHAP